MDLYYNSVRLVSANALWGISLLLIGLAAARTLLALPLLVVMVPLTAGLMGMATTVVRRETLVWPDYVRAIRLRFWSVLGLGALQLLVTLVAAADVSIGLATPGLLGPILVIGGLYTLVAVGLLATTTWPLLLDPVRAGERIGSLLRLGFLLVVAHPVRISLVALLVTVIGVVSVPIVAALVTVSGAFTALILAHYVLPAADRLEGRETLDLPEP